MRESVLYIILMVMLLSISCSDTFSPVIDNDETESPLLKTDDVINATNNFGFEIFQKINANEDENKNLFISPVSITMALAMAYNGANGNTKLQMEEALRFNEIGVDEINNILKDLAEKLETVDEKVLLSIANSIWYKQGFPVDPSFIDINKNYYSAKVRELDFSKTEECLEIINGWIEDNTNGKIKDMLKEIPASAVMYLVNAVYFNGTWKYEFDPEQTTDRAFFVAQNEIIQVPTMVQKADFYYYENNDLQSIELPYGEGNYTMLILLPKPEKTTGEIIDKMNKEYFNSIVSGYEMQEDLQIYLPKFKFEYEKELKEILIAMGMSDAFGGGVADFSKISPERDLYISKVKHKAFVEVNEEGTEAAAATVVEFVETSVGPGQVNEFKVDRPFVFAIKEKNTNTLVFMGKVIKPEQD